ncbi:uncharacterized protein MONOS_11394 [Monocercomonoides exilis]|uniref:uncharacterized protein n=1 Tax=Monocercomonoides exilis TaxID=2049356 RepID=UPI00355A2487|nr:hypothetical protein MONOS_11394 [Monocercomonoides exilis]|eukprot:MONOS_11394.1-p1 / transcript=MONOS_11394.1 / gene=MONOS_11394 / organism=Monocercomonoides_exilis_PA203 / gene_product=unspecified product / transcript_product=unspecified product / location=Mono_scaffold00569:14723-15487(-) / protein_length=132 / sequence_SO=supercontig / SO=protein_coding / is_pseudo=false
MDEEEHKDGGTLPHQPQSDGSTEQMRSTEKSSSNTTLSNSSAQVSNPSSVESSVRFLDNGKGNDSTQSPNASGNRSIPGSERPFPQGIHQTAPKTTPQISLHPSVPTTPATPEKPATPSTSQTHSPNSNLS